MTWIPSSGGGIAGVAVMVTADQNHLQLRPPGPPPSDRGERRRRDAAGLRVEQVAEDNEAACTGPGQHAVEPG